MFALFALYLHYFALYLHCICTAALCVAPVVPFPLCTALAGLAGLGWAGVSVLCHREGSFSPGATWRGQTRGHMPIHCTTHMPGSVMVARRREGPCSK